MGEYLLAIDEGTTGVTALVLDRARQVVARSYKEIGQSYPHPGWVEQDPREIIAGVVWAAKSALGQAKATWGDVAAIGLANQRETTVLWDRRTGTPVGPAIVWQDRRTSAEAARLKPHASWLRKRTGLVADPYFCATKLAWMLKDDKVRARAQRGELAFGTVDSWVAWNLTGRHITDPSNASRTLLYALKEGEWDEELLDLFAIPAAVLPEIVGSSEDVGTCRDLGGAHLASLVGDQQSALFGQRCFRSGQAKTTFGTGAFLLQHTGKDLIHSRNGLLSTRAASHDGRPRFALEGAVFTAGAAIQWLRDQLGILRASPEVDELAAQVPDTGGVMVVPAFTGLGAPNWDPEARGAIMGLNRGSNRRHLSRAVLESIALQSTQVLLAMEKDSKKRLPSLRVDGGAARSDLLLQMQADLLQRPVVRPENVETTAMGAALLAGLAVNAWSMADLERADSVDTFEPRADAKAATAKLVAWRKAVAAVRLMGTAGEQALAAPKA